MQGTQHKVKSQKSSANSACSGGTVVKLYWRSLSGDTLAETDGAGSTTNPAYNEYVFFAGRRIASRNGSGAIFYYFADQLGSTRTITTGNGPSQTPGQLCYDADFTPYGQEISYTARLQTTACPPNYRFTGYEYDSETGLDYAFARYYSPRLGRFLSTDPLSGFAGPQSLNAYAYALNNPLNTIDPTGQVSCPPIPVVPNPCSMAQMQSHLGGDLWGVNSDWWDEFDLVQLAFTPTAVGVAIEPYLIDNEPNPNFGTVYLIPLYGNWDALAFLGPVIWSPWNRVLATMEGPLPGKTSTRMNPRSDRFVALPDSYTAFEGNCVRVMNEQTGQSEVVPVGDVGPWNGGGTQSDPTQFNDAYWSPGPGGPWGGSGFQPPETSTGIDLRGRTVSRFGVGSGIDISAAVQSDLGFKGNTPVAWRFEACPVP